MLMVWVMVGQVIWAEDFQSAPLGQTPPGWQVLNASNMAHAASVENSCYGYPGNTPPLLCMDAVFQGIGSDTGWVEVISPAIAFPLNGQVDLRLSYDWTMGGNATDGAIRGKLKTFVRTFSPGTGWSPWHLMAQHADAWAGRYQNQGNRQILISSVPGAESLQILFRTEIIDSTAGASSTDTGGVALDNLTLEVVDTTVCCHLVVDPPQIYPDSQGNGYYLYFPSLCADQNCPSLPETFEITVVVNGDTVLEDTVVLSDTPCVYYAIPVPAQPGLNTIELYDNDCATQPYLWRLMDVEEQSRCEVPVRRFTVLVLRRHERVDAHFQEPALIVGPDGRSWRVQPGRSLKLPPGSYRFRQSHRSGTLLILP